jgi:tryptophan-rich sensory protein
VAAGAAFCVAMLGGVLTDIGPWYAGLRKPAWQPPDALFGPAWTVIFTCTAIAAVRAWDAAVLPARRQALIALIAVNGVLNVLWTVLFFQWRRPDWALVEVVPLWLSVLALVVVLGRWSRRAGLLLLPYLAWVAFAARLNLELVRLNAPFGRF